MKVGNITGLMSGCLEVDVYYDGELVAKSDKYGIPPEVMELGVNEFGLEDGRLWIDADTYGTDVPHPTLSDLHRYMDSETVESVNPSDETIQYAIDNASDPKVADAIRQGFIDGDFWLDYEVFYLWLHSGELAIDI